MDVVKELDEYGKNKLASLMKGLLIEIMGKERYEYLLENPKDKANRSYKRSLNTGLGKLNLEFPRTSSGEFRSNLLPPKYQRYNESFGDLIFSFLVNVDSKQEIIYKMKLRGLDFSEKAYTE
jgi:putative transposase